MLHRSPDDPRRNERGSIAPLIALLALVAAGLSMGAARMGAEAARAARARTAADAAALAGAGAGEGAAKQVAARNGAELTSFVVEGQEIQVLVTFHGIKVSARAVASTPAHGVVDATGLDPELRRALTRAESLLGGPVPISSGWRSREHQQRLYDQRGSNPYPVARPGSSKHEQGLAIDVPISFVPSLARVGPEVGLCRPLPRDDPVHFELCHPTPSH